VRSPHLPAVASENLPLPVEINPSSFSTYSFLLSALPLPPLWLSYCHRKINLFLPFLIFFLSHFQLFHSVLDVSTEASEQKHTTQVQTLDTTALFSGAPEVSGSSSTPLLEAAEAGARNPVSGVTYHRRKFLPNFHGQPSPGAGTQRALHRVLFFGLIYIYMFVIIIPTALYIVIYKNAEPPSELCSAFSCHDIVGQRFLAYLGVHEDVITFYFSAALN